MLLWATIAVKSTATDSKMVLSDSSDSEDSFDDIDLACDVAPDLEEGYVIDCWSHLLFLQPKNVSVLVLYYTLCRYRGLDLGTLHQTLPESMWDRHERRAPASRYKPSRDMGRYKATLKNWMPVRKSDK